MIGIVDVGGGLRGVFGAGVLDSCLAQHISFDYCIGVSAGSGNLSSFLAGQQARNFQFYVNYSFRPEYMSLKNYLRTRSYVDLDYIYGELSNSDGESPLDYPAMAESGKTFVIVATDAETGKPVYFDMHDMKQDDYAPVKASSCVPVVNRPYPIDGRLYFDGGISDPIPLQKALDAGCEKVVVILTRPRHFYRSPDADARTVRILRRHYPRIAEQMARRAERYNTELELAKRYEQEGRVLLLAPRDISGMKTLTKDKLAIIQLYRDGLAAGKAIPAFLAHR